MTTILTIANHKGGVGKTTTAVSLGYQLAAWGKPTLIVDLDPQGQCSTSLGLSPAPDVYDLMVSRRARDPRQFVSETGRENLHIISGDGSTGTIQMLMIAEDRPVSAVLDAVKPLRADYDYIVFDTPPSVGGLQERAIWASDYVIVPTLPEYLSSDGVSRVTALMKKLWSIGWTGQLLGILITHFDEQTRESRSTLDTLKGTFGNALLSPIHRATVMRECAAHGMTIFEYDPDSRAAQEYMTLARYVVQVSR